MVFGTTNVEIFGGCRCLVSNSFFSEEFNCMAAKMATNLFGSQSKIIKVEKVVRHELEVLFLVE